MRPSEDPEHFIRANTRLRPVPYVPEISLHVADEATELWQRTEEELDEIGLPPPFWAFAWAGGQALARYLLDHPDVVAGRSVLDVASGSGLCAIASAKAGARHVAACDLDLFAVRAIGLNAAANGVGHLVRAEPRDLLAAVPDAEVILAADVFYEQDLAASATDWLVRAQADGRTVLIGDPGRTYLPRERLERVATYTVPVLRSLEDTQIKCSHVWRLSG